MALLTPRRGIVLWQMLFLLLGTSWLWAPLLNHGLSYRTTLISQYELPSEAYSWLFRTGDFLAGGLLALIAVRALRQKRRPEAWLLMGISVGLMADPLFSTTCRVVGHSCVEYFSFAFLLHALETVATSSLLFIIAVYDSWRRKKLVSIGFAAFQFLYGLLFLSQLADKEAFNTISQYAYETILLVWLAWYCRELLVDRQFATTLLERRLVKNVVAIWSFLNGVVAIVISLAHIELPGVLRLKGLYFSGNDAWLAQHGVVVGVIMLYLSRHLARGEARARQIFVLLAGLETLKYAVITPNAWLLLFYALSFCGLFVLRDDFDRGTLALTWKMRLRDLFVLVSGLLLASLGGLVVLDRDDRLSVIATHAFDHLGSYVTSNNPVPRHRLASVLLAHTISAFLTASVVAVIWVLFRPYKSRMRPEASGPMMTVLKKYTSSSEDYFKLWPLDKEYFWNPQGTGFIAYQQVGSSLFALADPIGPRRGQLIRQFNEWGRRHRLKTCYLPVYEASLSLYKRGGLNTLQIGSTAMIDVGSFLNDTARDKWWRWRINKAVRAGYAYRTSRPPHAASLLVGFKEVSDDWLGGGRAERGFALGHFDPGYLQICSIHYLEDKQGKIVAFTNELPQLKKSKVLTVDLLRYRPGSDAMAYLLYKMIENSEGQYHRFDLGFVPFAKAKGPLLTIAKALSTEKFSADGLERFKDKFNPDWQPTYLCYDGDLSDLPAIALNVEKLMQSWAS